MTYLETAVVMALTEAGLGRFMPAAEINHIAQRLIYDPHLDIQLHFEDARIQTGSLHSSPHQEVNHARN
jgi:hypothetical protein